jgi:hypothetical protein
MRQTRLAAPWILAAALLAAAGLGGCQAEGTSGELGSPFELHLNQTELLESEGLLVTFAELLSDSRCPLAVLCVWEGEARILMRVEASGRPAIEIELSTLSPARTFDGYRIRLVQLAPRSQSGEPIPLEDYVARLVVTKR